MSTRRYEKNPFTESMVVPVRHRNVRVSALGKDESVLVNQHTGEQTGTHVTSYKKVDSESFVKLFCSHIGLTFDLTSAGIKAFSVLLWAVQDRAIMKDEVVLDQYTLEDFLTVHAASERPLRLSLPTFRRGIAELEKAKILAKTVRRGRYFINPNFVFNGDRLAFTTVIDRKG